MLGAGLQFGRSRGDDRLYNSAKARRNNQNRQSQDDLRRAQSDVTVHSQSLSVKDKSVVSSTNREQESREGFEETPNPVATPPLVSPLCNLERFLDSITPSVPAQYLSKTTMRGWRTCDMEFQPHFVLGDLWESFKEWSAYGAGVPLVLDDSDRVVQYYVPYLSAIQIYGDPSKGSTKSRQPGEDSDSDHFRDSSSEGGSDSEHERCLNYLRDQRNHHHLTSEVPLRMDRLSLRDQHAALQEDCSSDDGETGLTKKCLLFEYFERGQPYGREPLADKILDLARRFPELKILRSCDLLSSSWISVAWYPIYRIPVGPTLKDLEACFLTFHSLHTPMSGSQCAQAPVMTFLHETDGVPKISLPVFGLASYKFKASWWMPDGGSDRQLLNSLLQAADKWLTLLQVNHPDFLFFSRR
ncbi:hypothetical protein LOK49_LG10G00772 [Camellia lanceoleosa]|uniref:Uncharacterized protein n=1 Tax=Camellia lanceoleosa TaxID=1840588 RepID=A0ACC0G936_9ERIC|nr:hypothetical protein LOK49_LG10G00772 [Camellia lanceoleosa]